MKVIIRLCIFGPGGRRYREYTGLVGFGLASTLVNMAEREEVAEGVKQLKRASKSQGDAGP